MPTDSFAPALARLEPANRALLDLSLRRGMRPEEIGDLLGTDPESVIVAREAALEQLGVELGLEEAPDLDDLRAWEQRFRESGVEFTPIREAEFGYHLNFRDPDGTALELAVSKESFAAMENFCFAVRGSKGSDPSAVR